MRGAGRLLPLAAILGVALIAGRPPEARADAWKDEKLGFAFSYPSHWSVVPVDPGEWLVAKFTSNREYEWADTKNNLWTRQRPYIEVVCIPYAVKEDRGATVELTDKGAKVARTAPWRDVKEYMDKTFQDRGIGGFYFSGEDETTVGGMKVRRLEITVDKNVEGNRRIYGWEFAAEDCYWGLVAEILVQEEKGLKPDLFQSFATFRTFARTGNLPSTARTGEDVTVKGDGRKKEEDLSPEERKKRREDATARALAKIKSGLAKDWMIRESRNFIAVSHSDPKYTQEVLSHAEALRAWLEQEFGYVGSGYAGKVIIRILADNDEYRAFTEAKYQSRAWDPDSPEAYTYKDKEGWNDWKMSSLNGSIYSYWMRDKNRALLSSMPRWIEEGLRWLVGQARSKNGRIEFKPTTWDSVTMKNLRRGDQLIAPQTFFSTTEDALWALPEGPTQAQFFVQFLTEGAGSRNPRYRNLLSDYIKNLIFLLDSEKAPDPAGTEGPRNEEEEQKMVQAARNAWKQREAEVLQKLLEKTFPGWTGRDWDAFNAAYVQDLK